MEKRDIKWVYEAPRAVVRGAFFMENLAQAAVSVTGKPGVVDWEADEVICGGDDPDGDLWVGV
jgi:hypothetical protein